MLIAAKIIEPYIDLAFGHLIGPRFRFRVEIALTARVCDRAFSAVALGLGVTPTGVRLTQTAPLGGGAGLAGRYTIFRALDAPIRLADNFFCSFFHSNCSILRNYEKAKLGFA